MDKIQAVILAAGKGTRMLPLTQHSPKPMQEVSGKNLLQWKIEALPDEVDEVIIVIGYLGDVIRQYFGNEYNGKKMSYVVQEELNGTAGALWAAKELLRDRFILMMGDDLYGRSDIKNMLAQDFAIGGYPVHRRETGGEITKDANGNFDSILEERHFVEDGYVNTNLLMLRKELFDQELVRIPGKTEFGLPHTILPLSKKIGIPLVEVKKWFQITEPGDLTRAEEFVEGDQHLG